MATKYFLKRKVSKAYHLYRNTRVAIALFETIEELLEEEFLTPEQAVKVVSQFDYSVQKVMRAIQSEMHGHNYWSFEGQVKTYKNFKDLHFHQYVLKNVHIYQHFSARQVQNGLLPFDGKRQTTANKREFDKKKESHDVKFHFGQVSLLHIVAQSYLEYPITTKTVFDPYHLKCKIDDAIQHFNVNPRLAFYYLSPLEQLTEEEKEELALKELEEEPVMLNRFKSSAMMQEKYSQDSSGADPGIKKPSSFKTDINANSGTKFKFKYTSFLRPNSSIPSIKTSRPRKLTG